MGRLEKRPENPREKSEPFGTAETALRAVTEELQIIQRNLLKSLHEDLKRLQTEKMRLAEDIKRLKDEKEQLQQGQHINEQQALVRQLAQVLANHISLQLQSKLENLVTAQQSNSGFVNSQTDLNKTNPEEADKLFSSLDDTLTITVNALQQELKNYQSSFSQQLSRMSIQQQQGEALLAELVNRLRFELEQTPAPDSSTLKEISSREFISTTTSQESYVDTTAKDTQNLSRPAITTDIIPQSEASFFSAPTQKPPSTEIISPPEARVPEQSLLKQMGILPLSWAGVWLIVLSTVVSSLYNVALKVIFHSSFQMFGLFEVEHLISPTLGNTLLIMMLRMLVVVPLMSLLAPILHPRVWQDLQNLADSVQADLSPANATTKRVLVLSIVSGCFLFLSQVLTYLAIGRFPTGVAIALFFIYPVISGLLSWILFRQDEQPTLGRDRLTAYGGSAVASICAGCLLVLLGVTGYSTTNTFLTSTLAFGSGIAFAFYVVLTRICAAKLHPVSFTLINFVTMLLLSFVGLIVPLPAEWSLQLNTAKLLELILSTFILGVLTLCGYVLNNFALRKIGATRAAIFGAGVPVLTVIFAGLIIQETLQPLQILGVILVTLGAATFSYDKMRNRSKPSRSTN